MPGTQQVVRPSPVIKHEERTGANLPLPVIPANQPVVSAPVKKVEGVENVEVVPIEMLTEKIESLERFLATLNNKTIEDLWKDISYLEERPAKKSSVSVARCYPFSNRAPDVLPYDFNRVVLQEGRDDYINASHVTTADRGHGQYIVSQAPLAKGFQEFWWMIWQEGIETVVCLATDLELAEALYFPKEKGSVMKDGCFSLTTQSIKNCVSFTERVLKLSNSRTGQTRALIHLQILGWQQPEAVLETAEATTRLRGQQRYSSKPVLVHCLDGGSRSGSFLTLNSWLQEKGFDDGAGGGGGIPEIKTEIQNLLMQRKGIIRDKMVLKHIYQLILVAMKRIISKEAGGAVVPMAEQVTPRKSSEPDFVGLTVASLKVELQKDRSLSPEMSAMEQKDPGESFVPTEERSKASPLSQIDLSHTPDCNIPTDLTQLAELSLTESKTKKITKEDFFSPSKKVGPTNNDSDPLSQLDPLWSMK